MTLSTQEGKQPKGFAYTGMVFCSISICAAFSVMLHIVHAVRARQTHGARRPVGAILLLVGWMSLADMFWAAKFLWSYSIETLPGATCTFLGALGQFTSMCTITFNFVIAVDVFLTERNPFKHKSADMLSRYFQLVAFMSVVTTGGFGAAGCYGPATDGTCWVDPAGGNGTVCEGTFFGILLTYVTFCVGVLLSFAWRHGRGSICGARRASSLQNMRQGQLSAALLTRMVVFTTAFVLLWVPETIFFINAKAGGPSSLTKGLGKLQTLSIPLTGTINYVVWRKQLLALSAPANGAAHRSDWGCSGCRVFSLCRRRDGDPATEAGAGTDGSLKLELESTEYNPGAPGMGAETVDSEGGHDEP